MPNIIGIRREDKNKWERRVPLTPTHLAQLNNQKFIVQSSPVRVFIDDDYAQNNTFVQEDLTPANVIFAVKEVPPDLLQPHKTYLFFSHTIKGQPYNMPLLQKLLDLNCQLIDYERIVDDNNRRLIFFGRHAGLAGMIDTLHTLGRRLAWEGLQTPLADVKLTYQYGDLPTAQQAIRRVGRRIAEEGLPASLAPLVIGVAGYGNVSRGAQEILDLLPVRQISPAVLLTLAQQDDFQRNTIYNVVFKEADTVEPITAGQSFDLQEFFQHPERYRSKFEQYLPHLSVLVNCIYWDTPYPRLLTTAQTRQMYAAGASPKLRVIGDISCDIEGGIEITVKPTTPDEPAFYLGPGYRPGHRRRGRSRTGGHGHRQPAVRTAGRGLNQLWRCLVTVCTGPGRRRFQRRFRLGSATAGIKRATIVYHGNLTPDYEYLVEFL